MQRCGFCQMVSGVLRRAMCVGSRRGSSESYYREIGDQDTLKIEDKSSDFSDDAQEETSLCRRCHDTPRVSPQSSLRGTPRTSRQASPQTSPRPSRRASPQTSPRTSPRPSRRASPRTSPRPSRHASLKTSPSTSPPPSRRASLQKSTGPSRQTSSMTSPRTSRRATSQESPGPSRQTSSMTSPRTSRRATSQESPGPSRQTSSMTSPRTSRRATSQESPGPSRQTYSMTSPRTSRRATSQESPRPSRQSCLKRSQRTSRQTSSMTSPRTSRRATSQESPGPSRQTYSMTSPRTSRRATSQESPRPSRQSSLKRSQRTSRQTSPSTSRQASQKITPKPKWRASPGPSGLSRKRPQTPRRMFPSSPHSSTDSSPESSARSSPQSSRRTTPKTSPWSSRRSSLLSSPSSSSRFSSRRLSWLRYTRGSRLYYLHSEVQTDSMEEHDPENYEMKMKAAAGGRFLTVHKRRKKRLLTRCLFRNQGLLDDLMMGQVQRILDQSVHWQFNAFTLETVSGGRCLPVLCVHLFQMYGLLAHFQLDVTKAWKLFSLIEEGYHSSNPYHNSIHAADVTQAMHCFLQQERIRDHLTPLEILASLLAAIAHDLDHPGVNQPFLIATSNHLAALYKNTSVLENHHWRSAMSCLVESGILDHLPPIPGLRQTLENQIRSLILATDITRQQEYLTHFKNHLDKDTLDMTKSEHRHLVLQIALKCADISNPCRPWEISRKWSFKVCEEFFRQGDYERQLNLPVTALCDRHTNSIPKIQTGFFKFVVTPLIREWHRFLHNELSHQMFYNLVYNQQRWETLMNEEDNEETKTEISDADDNNDDENRKSGSQKLLLPPRRGSLNPPPKKKLFRDKLRRFSVPLNVFQDVRFRLRERSRAASLADAQARRHPSTGSSQPSLHSQLSVRGHCSHSQESDRPLNSDLLLSDCTIASITTAAQAARLNNVLKEGGNLNKLVKQPTLPPVETASTSRCIDEDDLLSRFRPDFLRPIPSTSKKESKYSYSGVADLNNTDSEDTSTSVEVTEPKRPKEKENSVTKSSRRDTSTVGSQLRDNLTRLPLELELESDPLLQRRRKSMPAEVLLIPPREKKIREAPVAVPQFLRRTFSKESWSRRRGSAPSPVEASELRGLASLGSLHHSVNGGRRKPSLAVTCQQWLAKAASVQERTLQFPRRSSLPVEVMTGISTC